MTSEPADKGPPERRKPTGRPRDPESLFGLRRRKLRLQVADLELALAVKRKSLVPIEGAASVVAARFAACRSRLLAIPAKVAPLCVAAGDVEGVRQVLTDAVEEALADLVADAESLAG